MEKDFGDPNAPFFIFLEWNKKKNAGFEFQPLTSLEFGGCPISPQSVTSSALVEKFVLKSVIGLLLL